MASSAASVAAPELSAIRHLLGLGIYEAAFSITAHQGIILQYTVNFMQTLLLITSECCKKVFHVQYSVFIP